MKRLIPIIIISVILIITIYPLLLVKANPAVKIVGKVITREMRDTGKSIITKAGVRTSNKTALERANEAWFARLAKEEAEAIRRAAERATPSGTPGWLKVTIGATLWFTGVDILIDIFSSDDPVEYYTNEVKPGETVIPGGYGISYKKVESPYSPDRWTLLFTTTNGDTYYLNTDRPISANSARVVEFTRDQELIGVDWEYANDYVMAHIRVSNIEEFEPSKYGFTAAQWDAFMNYRGNYYKRILILRLDDEIRYIPILSSRDSKDAFYLYAGNFTKGPDGRYIRGSIGLGLTAAYRLVYEDGTISGTMSTNIRFEKPEGFLNYGLDNLRVEDFLERTYMTAYFGSHQYDTNGLIRVISDLPNATFAPQPAPALLPNPDPELWPDEEYVIEVLIPDPNFYPDTSSAINLNQEFLQGLTPSPNLSPQPAPAEAPATSSIQIEDPGTPGLKAITQKFPFSLPWDIYHLISLIAAEPRAPVFVLDTDFDGIPIYFEHDMSYLDPYIGYFRTFVFIAAAISIVYATRSLLGGAK